MIANLRPAVLAAACAALGWPATATAAPEPPIQRPDGATTAPAAEATPSSDGAPPAEASAEPAVAEPAATDPTEAAPTAADPTAAAPVAAEPAAAEPAASVAAPAATPSATVASTTETAPPPEPSAPPDTTAPPDGSSALAAPTKRDRTGNDRPRFPRLVVAGGPFIGPHEIGSEECRVEARECIKPGSFFGLGLQAELRARLYKPLYAHVRGFIARNVSPEDRVYRGVGGGALGLGGYGRRLFGRAELMVLSAYGDNRFTPPFHNEATGRDTWGNLAGLISAGFRQPLAQRLGLELWGGLMIGPTSERTIPSTEPDRRVLPTFMVGLNLFADAWQ